MRDTPETQQLGLSGLIGDVYGITAPSVTGIVSIGTASEDCAINVHFGGRNESHWFSPDLVEFIDHHPGAEIALDGVPKTWTRNADGRWKETRRPWWKFW